MQFESTQAQVLAQHIQQANLPPYIVEKVGMILTRVDSLIKGGNFREYEIIENYINWLCSIPFGKFTKDNLDLVTTKSLLDENHYGLGDVKSKILEYLSVLKLNQMQIDAAAQASLTANKGNSANAPVMLFIGVQGIGKTSMAKSIAGALGRKYVRIALGGMSGVHEIKGKSRGMENAEPGQVVKALVSSGSMNPLILFDEIDKVSEADGVQHDIMAALLEVFDPEQNSNFTDRYLDFPIDISKCMFVATANNLSGITSALLDRMELVRFTSYNDEEKILIAKNYLLPRVRKASGLTEEQLKFNDEVWDLIVRPLGFDAGIRELERTIMNIARKVAKKIVDGVGVEFEINKDNFREYIPDDFGIFT